METGSIMGNIDVAQVTLYAFWVFFAALIWYIRQEDRREGYPLEDDVTGRFNKNGWLFIPPPKTFVLPHGQGTVSVPNDERDTRPIAAERTAAFSGSPLQPTGDPMTSGIGPGSWAERADIPDRGPHGEPIIVPMRVADGFEITEEDDDPRGMRVIGCDRVAAGTVAEVWVDRAEHLIRYLEVTIGTGEKQRNVLLPINFCVFKTVRGREKIVYVNAITAEQFAGVPAIAGTDQITKLEEEKVVAYYGGGQLYATPRRQEPLV